MRRFLRKCDDIALEICGYIFVPLDWLCDAIARFFAFIGDSPSILLLGLVSCVVFLAYWCLQK